MCLHIAAQRLKFKTVDFWLLGLPKANEMLRSDMGLKASYATASLVKACGF